MASPILISVIIPVFNDLNAIQQTLLALRVQQQAPSFEIIVVDNGSTDGSVAWLKQQDDIHFILENKHLASPYSCRNRGFDIAQGELIVLLDSTCTPSEDWLAGGYAFHQERKSQLFGGKVVFDIGNGRDAGKMLDSVTNVQMKDSIINRQEAKTANLWLHRDVLAQLGPFREGVRSGEDVRWTRHAVESGFVLDYCEQGYVTKYARSTTELLNKQFRVGKGQIERWAAQGNLASYRLEIMKRLWPQTPSKINRHLKRNEQLEITSGVVGRVFIVAYLANLATFAGNLVGAWRQSRQTAQPPLTVESQISPNELMVALAEKAMQELNEQGYLTGGHNGPYYDEETPVRNTAHWAVIFAALHKKTAEDKYRQAAERCGQYLLSPEARPMQAAFYCRQNPKKDLSNGTIGQAWAIEGLLAAYEVTKAPELLNLAKQTFLLHPFDESYKLWRIVNVDGSFKGFDMTFNHQLWLAAAGAQILALDDEEEIRRQCQAFMDNVPDIIRVAVNGLIKHDIHHSLKLKDKLRTGFDLLDLKLKSLKTGKSRVYKENGYHLFNLYAFALIKQAGISHSFFQSSEFQRALNYAFSDELLAWLTSKSIQHDIHHMPKVQFKQRNIYGFGYNPAGFELAYIAKVFGCEQTEQVARKEAMLALQLNNHFECSSGSIEIKDTEDQATLAARFYEYARCYELH